MNHTIVFYLALMLGAFVALGVGGHKARKARAVNKTHRRRMAGRRFGITAGLYGLAGLMTIGVWGNYHAAGSRGHVGPALGQYLIWTYSITMVVGGLLAVVYTIGASRVCESYERKRKMSRELAHNRVAAQEEVVDHRLWHAKIGDWTEVFVPTDQGATAF